MSSLNTTFDPLTQEVTLLMADGVTTVGVQLSDIDHFFHYNCKTSINYGSQLGACTVMLIVTALLTAESKRRKPIYILNLLSLIFGILRALLLSLYAVSPWTELYTFYTLDFGRVPRSAYATSAAGTVIPLFMTVTVNASLFLQAHTVSKVMKKQYVYGITGLSGVVFLLAVGFRFAQVVTNSMSILNANFYFDSAWITTGTLATETISIWFYSIIFTAKLCWTIHTRKSLGFQQWSYIQILAAMGGCTMVIPAIFAILEYVTPDDFPEAGTLAITMVALLLPLSSLWASMATTERSSSFNFSQLWGSRISHDGSESGRHTFQSQSTATSKIDYNSDRKPSTIKINPTTIDTVIGYMPTSDRRDSTELDLERMGVRVDRSYSIHSEK